MQNSPGFVQFRIFKLFLFFIWSFKIWKSPVMLAIIVSSMLLVPHYLHKKEVNCYCYPFNSSQLDSERIAWDELCFIHTARTTETTRCWKFNCDRPFPFQTLGLPGAALYRLSAWYSRLNTALLIYSDVWYRLLSGISITWIIMGSRQLKMFKVLL